MSLEGKVAIVTGGGGGFGTEISKRLVAVGAKVVVVDIVGDNARRTADALGDAAIAMEADIGKAGPVKEVITATVKAFGGLDIIVNNAGLSYRPVRVVDMDESLYDRVFEANVKSIFHFTKYGVPELDKRGGGSIVNIASTSAVKPRAGNTVYATSKAAAIAFTKASALELAKQKIRVNTILPVASLTPMLTGMFEGDNSSRIEAMEAGIPLGRLGQPKDIAAGVMFFLSDEADFITGVALPVDGGWTAS
jgi:3-oxoacyl-[acyl-carrier protein] reductase